jgi:hypothetical protein
MEAGSRASRAAMGCWCCAREGLVLALVLLVLL